MMIEGESRDCNSESEYGVLWKLWLFAATMSMTAGSSGGTPTAHFWP
jgi:hypothetical protein